MTVVDTLLKKHRIISDQVHTDELRVLLTELEKVIMAQIQGDVVEFGCYEGTTALFEQRLIDALKTDKKLWLYDSFEGLPEKAEEDESVFGELFTAGALKASKARLERNFHKAGLELPHIKRAWFWELEPSDLPENICFAFLDGDFYESIIDSLKLVWQKLSKGGVIIVDDYKNAKLPGASKAVDEFFSSNQVVTLRSEASLAIMKKITDVIE